MEDEQVPAGAERACGGAASPAGAGAAGEDHVYRGQRHPASPPEPGGGGGPHRPPGAGGRPGPESAHRAQSAPGGLHRPAV